MIIIVVISNGVFLFKIESKAENDANVINLAGRHRMLSQEMSKLSLFVMFDQNEQQILELREARDRKSVV